jgi:hypothetical protein
MPLAKEFVLRDLVNAPTRGESFFASHHGSESHVTIMRVGGKSAAAITTKIEPAPPAKIRAATIAREIAARADELRRRGVHNPITQARNEAAKRWHHASGAALHRWLRRNR